MHLHRFDWTWMVVVLALAPAAACAQGGYLLRYEPGSRAEAVLDSLGFRQNPITAVADTEARRRSNGLAPQANRLHADFVPFDGLARGEGLVAIRRGVPGNFWHGIPGVLSVGDGSAVFPKGGLPNDPTFPAQWNLDRIEAAGAWNYTTGGISVSGRQIVIGVIEANGFDLDHPELVDQYYRNPGEIPGNGVDDDRNGYVDDVTGVNFTNRTTTFARHPHGVQVSGVLAARSNNGAQSTGLNWSAKLLPFQVDSVYKWALALDYLTSLRTRFNQSGGRDGAYVVVANCSLGNQANCATPANAELNAAIDRAGRAGILVVGAVGNDTGDAERQSDLPASCASDFLVAVTSADRSDEILAGAGYSARQVDLSAPGAPFGGLDYQLFGRNENTFGQTSGATPQVAGVVALLYAALGERLEAEALARPAQVAAYVKELILRSVDPVASQSGKVASGGRLNARRAIEALQVGDEAAGGHVLVRFAQGSPAPETIPTPGASLVLVDTLSTTWRMYRYRAPGTSAIDVAAVAGAPGVVAAERERRLVGTGRGFRFGGGDEYLKEIAQPTTLALVRAQAPPGVAREALAAVFDLGFGESRLGTPGPELNPFAPSIGLHGEAVADILATVAGSSVAATVLRFRGYRLGDWVAAAADVTLLRTDYEANPTTAGRRVVAFATGLAGVLDESDSGAAKSTSRFVLDRLLEAGIIPVLPQGASAGVKNGTLELPQGTLVARGSDGELTQTTTPTLLTPGRRVAFGRGQTSCEVSGDVAAVAQVAGGVTLLNALECASDRGVTPRRGAARLVATLFGGSPREPSAVLLDLVVAARLRIELCSGEAEAGAALVRVFPNPIGPERRVRIIYSAQEAGSVSVFDVTGKRLAGRIFTAPEESVGQLSLDLEGLAAGVYVVQLVSGGVVDNAQVVVL